MLEQPKVSIIVPVYNVEKFLDRCLNSLINQTLKEIEIICINDGSVDNSLQILEKFAKQDDRITILNQKNSGQSTARNRGIDKASGIYLGFVDSDDWVDLNYFEKLYTSAEKYNCDMAVSGIIRLNKWNKKFHLKFAEEKVTDNTDEKFELCDVPELSYACNKIYKRKSFISKNLKFEEGIFFEDVIMTPKILYSLGKLITVPDTYYYYWRNPNSTVTKRTDKVNNDSIYAHNKAMEFIKEHNIDISSHEPITKRYKFLGFTILKIKQKGNKKVTSLFNIIKW